MNEAAVAQLWGTNRRSVWQEAVSLYDDAISVVADQNLHNRNKRYHLDLHALDVWVRHKLTQDIQQRVPKQLTVFELAKIVQLKMTRSTFRPRNQSIVESNTNDKVMRATATAFSIMDQASSIEPLKKAMAVLCKLAGVGPATASLVLSIVYPHSVPFFDELQARVVLNVSEVSFTLRTFDEYYQLVMQKANKLRLHPADVTCALWTASVITIPSLAGAPVFESDTDDAEDNILDKIQRAAQESQRDHFDALPKAVSSKSAMLSSLSVSLSSSSSSSSASSSSSLSLSASASAFLVPVKSAEDSAKTTIVEDREFDAVRALALATDGAAEKAEEDTVEVDDAFSLLAQTVERLQQETAEVPPPPAKKPRTSRNG
eukprot:ANDGO_00739.mRNA.1 hypothetical protein SARC_00495